MASPKMPSSFICSIIASGYSLACSISRHERPHVALDELVDRVDDHALGVGEVGHACGSFRVHAGLHLVDDRRRTSRWRVAARWINLMLSDSAVAARWQHGDVEPTSAGHLAEGERLGERG